MAPVLTLKVLASLLQLHGPGATIQSDHQGIDAILGDVRDQVSNEPRDTPAATDVAFRRAGFLRGGGGGAFRRGAAAAGGGFRRAGFRRI
jgi:hypothetical protein